MVGLAVEVSSHDGADECQRQDDEDADASHRQHGAERDGTRRVVVNGDEVDAERGSADHAGNEEGGEQHLADPNLTAHPRVQRPAKVSVDG